MLTGVGARPHSGVDHLLPKVRRLASKRRDAVDDVHDQVEAVEVVHHHHVERRRGRAFLLVTTHVQVVVVVAPVGQSMDDPGIAVVGEHDGPIRGEQRVELRVGHAVRVLGVGFETHEVDDVDDPDP